MENQRQTLIQTEDLHLEIEFYDSIPYLHCEVYSWSKSKYKEYLHYWELTLHELRVRGIDFLFCQSPDDKVTKFATMFGFKIIATGSIDILFMRF